MSVRVITDDAGLAALAAGWRTLETGVFQSWAWLSAWWAAFGNGRPVVAVLGPDAAPLGVLALYRYDADGTPRLLPMGVGISDYFDAALAPDAPPDAAARLLAQALAATDVSRAELLEMPPNAALRAAAIPPGWSADRTPDAPCPVLDLRAARFEDAIPPRAARKLRMNTNRCERSGAIKITTNADIPADLGLLARFAAARRDDGVLRDRRVRDMLARALPALPARLCVLRLGDTPAAAILAFREPGRIGFYLSGFDAAFADASPGSVLLGHMLRHAHADGIAEAHFLRGDEAYKRAWGALAHDNARCVLTRVRA